jgi:hypothetical protein
MQKLVLSGYRLVSSVDINVRQSAREIKNTQARDIDNIEHDGKDYTFNYVLVSWLLYGDYPVQSTNNWIL